MQDELAGFDWDAGNGAKCSKHGVSRREIEALFARPIMILPDETHSTHEERLRAIGYTAGGRAVFVVFTLRERDGKTYIRPISARYMHKQEVTHFEKENPTL